MRVTFMLPTRTLPHVQEYEERIAPRALEEKVGEEIVITVGDVRTTGVIISAQGVYDEQDEYIELTVEVDDDGPVADTIRG